MSERPSAKFYEIDSNQSSIHQRLDEVVQRHARHKFKAPLRPVQQAIFDQVFCELAQPVILDLGCGTAMSSEYLLKQYPNTMVLGVDKSSARLMRHPLFAKQSALNNTFVKQGRLGLLRADAIDLIRYFDQQKMDVHSIKLFYPNPWPKAAHLQRRWHGHAVFPQLLALGASIELRTTWYIYAEEFVRACHSLGVSADLQEYQPIVAASLFEKKYQAAEVILYRVQTQV